MMLMNRRATPACDEGPRGAVRHAAIAIANPVDGAGFRWPARAQITQRALDGSCAICAEAVDCFCAMLGALAGNVAVTLGAQGGIYVGGGIVPRLGSLFAASSFRRRFEQKGRLAAYLAQIPTYVITAEYPAFIGVSAILADRARACRGEQAHS